MSTLEDLQPNAAVRGILPDGLVTVVSVQWFGSEALEPTYKHPTGRVANELLYRHDETRLAVVEQGRPWSFDGDGQLFWLVSKAHRIRLTPSAPTKVAASPEVRAFPWTRMPSHARKPAPSRFLTHWKDA
jgi:hypothetical protein